MPSFAGVETSSELPDHGYLGTATWAELPGLGYLSRAGELAAAEMPTHPTLSGRNGGQSEGSPFRPEKGCDGIHFSRMGTKT